MRYLFLMWMISTACFANQRMYERNCTKCHNPDPSKAGPIGPELVSTPEKAFKQKVVHGTYPKNYKPKRQSNMMPKFAFLDIQVNSLYWYVQMFKGKKK